MKKSSAAEWNPKVASVIGIGLLALTGATSGLAQNIVTERYDNARTGANLSETQLSPSTVNSSTFGLVGTYAVSGSVYAQPLYVRNVTIGGAQHNVIYVATMNDAVYALDADTHATLWSEILTNPGATPVPIGDVTQSGANIVGNVGIESTPVIDPTTNTLYLVTRTKEATATCGSVNGNYCQRLHALDITTGAEKFGGPVTITAAVGSLAFDPKHENQRAALALANGQVYIAWASHQDQFTWYGWIMTYNTSTLTQTGTFVPSQPSNGIWMSGRAPAIDPSGNLYYMSGNGTWDGSLNFSESLLKFSGGPGLALLDWFTPDNHATLDANDMDFGSSGPLLIPGTSLVVGGGKFGTFYVANTASLGHVQSGNGQIVQSLVNNGGGISSGPVYWNRSGGAGPWMYSWSNGSGSGDVLKAYHFNGTTFDPSPVSRGTIASQAGKSAGVLALSANGGTPGTGIVWASMPLSGDGENGVHPGVLRAFNADNLSQELWDSTGRAQDAMGNWPKFNPPLIANGRVYVGTQPSDGSGMTAVNVYGSGIRTEFTDESIAGCNGSYILDWSAVSGATSYRLWSQPSPNRTFAIAKSLTTTTALVHAVNPGGTTFEVQACTGTSCGPIGSPVFLGYYSGCP
jgi:hypothetical protein